VSSFRSGHLLRIAVGVLVIAGCTPTNPPEGVEARDRLIEVVHAAPVGEVIDLAQVIDVDWDRLVILPPYATNAYAAERLGFPFDADSLPTSVNDNGSVYVFAKGDAAVVWFTLYWRDVSTEFDFLNIIVPVESARMKVSIDANGFREIGLAVRP
jgi:hypothetical protein